MQSACGATDLIAHQGVARVLLLPGWLNSGPDHWQSWWERHYGFQRVQQHDWERPLRGDWITQLEDVLLESDQPAVLVAHSLGCQLVAAWAAVSRNTARVRAALLVAPGDPQSDRLRALLPSWSPPVLQRLPFTARLLASQDDPYCSAERARQFAQAWNADWHDMGCAGHINAESGLGLWPQGYALIQDWLA